MLATAFNCSLPGLFPVLVVAIRDVCGDPLARFLGSAPASSIPCLAIIDDAHVCRLLYALRSSWNRASVGRVETYPSMSVSRLTESLGRKSSMVFR